MIKIYGKNCVNEAFRKLDSLEKVFLLDLNKQKDRNIIDILYKNKIAYEIVDKKKMDQIFGTSHQGYAAYRKDFKILDEAFLDSFSNSSRILLLDGIMDPHNLGAILRTVDAFGIDLWFYQKTEAVLLMKL